MTTKQLQAKRDGLEAQMLWAALHRGDRELMEVLRDESDHLSKMLGRPNASLAPSVCKRRPTDNAPGSPDWRMLAHRLPTTGTGSRYPH